jgi:hypothetical protein
MGKNVAMRNLALSATTTPRDAHPIIRSLLSHPDTHVHGLVGGFRFIKLQDQAFGSDPFLDSLVNHVTREANTFIGKRISHDENSDKIRWIARACLVALECYRDRSAQGRFGLEYVDVRCQALFNLAELSRSQGRMIEAGKHLSECEVLLTARPLSHRPLAGIKVPSIEIVRTCLSEILLLNGESSLAVSKSRQVIGTFRDRGIWGNSDLLIFIHSIILNIKSLLKSNSVIEAESSLLLAQDTLRLHPTTSQILFMMDSIEKDVRRARAVSAQRNQRLSERLVADWEMIAEGFDRFIQTDARKFARAKSASAGRRRDREVQSENRKSEIHNFFTQTSSRMFSSPSSVSKWVPVRSTRTGRSYYYNNRTGESRWKKPRDEII